MFKSLNNALLSLIFVIFLSGSTGAQIHLAGDLNNDLRVDFEDIQILGEQWLDPDCLISSCTANLNSIDGVNLDDFALLAQNWHLGPKVVINEIHYDPAIKTDFAEFVECSPDSFHHIFRHVGIYVTGQFNKAGIIIQAFQLP